MAALPTTATFDWIDLKFEDRQLLAKYHDTNAGSNWVIPSAQWAEGKADELEEAISDAEAAGVDVARYRGILASANGSLAESRYLEAAQLMMEAIEECRQDECSSLLELASDAYDEAVQDGIEVDRAQSFLTAARAQLEAGNYYGSKSFSVKTIEFIAEARSKVGESGLVCLGILTLLGLLGTSLGRGRHREG